jgi:small subunit ribosomal protein S15
MVARRRKLLDYLKLTSNERYQKLLKSLNLRR